MAKPGHTATLGRLSVTPSFARLVDGLLFSRPSAGPRRAARRGQEGRPEEAGSPQSPGAFGAAPDEAARGLRASVAPRRGGEQPGRIWAPAREDLVTQCASSATAPARLPPAHAASLSGIARVARWLGTLRLLSRGGLSATALSCPCPHPTAEAAPTHRRSPRGCAVGAGSQEWRGRCRSRAPFAVTRSSELSGLGRRRLPQRQSVCMTIGATRGEAVALALRLQFGGRCAASAGLARRRGSQPRASRGAPPPGDAEEGGAVLRPVQGAETTAGT